MNGALNGAAFRNEKSASSGSSAATTSATTPLKAAAALDAASSSEPTSKKTFQESKSPQTVEVKPQSNQQHRSSSPFIKQLSSPRSANRPTPQRAADSKKEKRSLKSFFRFSSSNKQQSASGNKKSANSLGLRRQSELNDSRSSLTSANNSNQNQDRAVENLVVRSAKLQAGFAVSSESARSPKSAKTTSTHSRARTDETSSHSVQHNSANQPSALNGGHSKPQHPPKPTNLKSTNSSPSYDRFHLNIISTSNHSPSHSQSGQHSREAPAANQTISSASSFLPSTQSSFSFLSDYSVNKNQITADRKSVV